MAINKQKTEVLNIIKNRKQLAEKQAENNLFKANEDAKFKKLYELERALIFKIADKESEKQDCTTEYSLLEKVKLSQKKVLAKLNMTEEDLKPQFSCKICSDEGIVNHGYCKCFKKELSNYLFKLSNVGELASFEKSDEKLLTKETKLLHKKMEEWCEHYKTSKTQNIVLCGNTGVGKTFLTSCMASKLIEEGSYVLFTTAFNLNNDMLRYYTTFNEEKEDIIRPYLDCDVLLIDDLGTEPILRNVTLEYLYLIINERTLNHKPIIITTNLDLNSLSEQYGDRIFSRIVNKKSSFLYEFKGEDIRLKK